MHKKRRDIMVSQLELEAYGASVRTALRLGGVFYGEHKSVALCLPHDADLPAYYETVRLALEAHPQAKNYQLVEVEILLRDVPCFDAAMETLKLKRAVVVLVPYGLLLPDELTVAVDRVVDVGAVKPMHLARAAASVLQVDVGLAQAEEIVSFKPKLWVRALRPGRTADEAVERLREVATVKRARWIPRVEELEGYGEAKVWALELATDISDWRRGKIAWSDVDRGLLLGGPTGTGKTLFAGAVARSCGVPLVSTSAARWQSKGHLGDMLGAMHRSFRDASSSSPCILFIDEIDAIGDRRHFQGHNVDYSVQVVNALLELLDGSSEREGVVVIAATNFPEKIDPALRRPGRLDRHIQIGLPDLQARKQILSIHLGHQLAEDDLKAFAVATSGCSGAEIEQIARDARRTARRTGRAPVAADLRALFPHETAVKSDDRQLAAIHEAGHAVVGLELDIGTIEAIVVPMNLGIRDDTLGYVSWVRRPSRKRSQQAFLDELTMLMAGMAAERVFCDDIFEGSGGGEGSDLQLATDLATKMLTAHGMGCLCYRAVSTDAELKELRRADPALTEKVHQLLSQQLERAESLLRAKLPQVRQLVLALEQREVVTGAVAARILGGHDRKDRQQDGQNEGPIPMGVSDGEAV